MSDSPSRLIDPLRLNALLGKAAGRVTPVALAECASTNTALQRLAAEGAASGTALVADAQTAGRGSRGRSWAASPEASLTFSVLWNFPGGLARLSGLSLAAGVGVARALARCGAQIKLKWPNDILYEGRKLGGILVELGGDENLARAVVAIGLNLRRPENIGDARPALEPAALDEIAGEPPDRHVLLAALLDELADVFDRFAREGFAGLRAEWLSLHAWEGRPVRVLRGEETLLEGVCAGVEADGALLVRTPGGVSRCVSGDVTLRPR